MEQQRVIEIISPILEEKYQGYFKAYDEHRHLVFKNQNYHFSFPSTFISSSQYSKESLGELVNQWLKQVTIEPHRHYKFDEHGNVTVNM